MALKDILSKYPDDTVFSLPDGTTATVADVRTHLAQDRESLTQRQQLVEQAELAIASKVHEFQQAGLLGKEGQVQQRLTDSQVRQAAANEYGLDPNDPLLGPVVKEFQKQMAVRDTELASLRTSMTDQLQRITGVVQTAVSANLEERYQSDFEKASKALPSEVKVEYQAAYEYANKEGFKDKFGRLDLSKAVDRMTWDKVKEVEKSKMRDDVTLDLESKNRLATATRPRVSSPDAHRPKTDFNPMEKVTLPNGQTRERSKSFDQALAEATNDTDLLESALRTATFGSVQ